MSLHRPGRRGRVWLASYVLVALLWPATGMLPIAILGLERPDAASAQHHDGGASQHHHDGVAVNHRHDASEVPGSPTHPEDHNCFECKVLQHLSRCVPPDFGPMVLPPPPTLFVARYPPRDTLPASFASPRPPIRGPPLLDA